MNNFKKLILITATAFILVSNSQASEIPYWLSDYEELYKEDPIEASRKWFKDAKMGMFVHFNLASLMELGSIEYKLWVNGGADERILEYVGISRDEYVNAKSKEEL